MRQAQPQLWFGQMTKHAWEQALKRAEPMAWHHQQLFSDITHTISFKQPEASKRVNIVDLAVTLTHAAIVTAGHSSGMANVCKNTTQQPQPRGTNQFLLEAEVLAHREAQRQALRSKNVPILQAQEVMQWAWLQQAMQNLDCNDNKYITPGGLHQSGQGRERELAKMDHEGNAG